MADLPVSRLNRLARSFTIVAQILLAAIVLAWPARAASKDEYANVHTVAIVSTIGDTLVLKRVGLTAFGNSEEKQPINWGLDELLTKDISAALSPRFTVKPVSFDYARMKDCEGWEKCIALLPPNPGIDAYIFVREASLYARGEALDPHGMGIYRAEQPFSSDGNMLHAFYQVEVVDAKTADRIDYGTARLPETVGLGERSYPETTLDPAPLPDSNSHLTPAQMEAVRPKLIALIQASYIYALINANLLPDSAAATQRK